MTEEQKEKMDQTRFIVAMLDDTQPPAIVGVFATEPEARACAENMALENPCTPYAVLQKLGTSIATLRPEWRSAAPVASGRASQ